MNKSAPAPDFFQPQVPVAEWSSNTRRWRWHKPALAAWLLLGVGLFLLHFYPIRFASLRAVLAAGALLWWSGAIWFTWYHKAARRGSLALSAMMVALVTLPGRETNQQALRDAYVNQLQTYTGTPYVWGGETRRGIDCSGFMRCPLIDANLRSGATTFNPALVRESLALWWHDASARELKDGYGSRTQLLFAARDLNTLSTAQLSQLQPGDMAVTANGVHVLAYLGNHTWIEADPSAVNGDSVIKVTLPSKIAWFNTSVRLVRWCQFK